jgi:maltose alpha-D-glucosyltransferase/alpha-amylase
MNDHTSRLSDNPQWYKDAIIYEVHVRSFFDSDGDGIGDFRGLTKKLDYLSDLGVTAIWLLPFYPSPLKDDGYDIADPLAVNPDYGNLRDFKAFLHEAHARGIRVITELVLNHTSDQHEWFQRARHAKPGSHWRDYYVWNDNPDKYPDARIIFKDFETSNWSWDPLARAYFWHRFYSHQPDLNFDNPQVRKDVLRILDHWLSMGVDGLRLDAVPYLFEREGTNCENLPETYEFIRHIRAHIDERYANRMLLAEANQWPEDAVAYFGRGDACHMAFHFPLMPRMFMALQMEDRFPIIDILEQTPAIPDSCQWALFLRNHDELTLEMVTDEERDYMYRMYARDPRARINLGIRRRLAPLLENDRRKIELMNVILFTMPGSAVLYYGDEIGMGDNYYLGDRNGVRTPMQWSADLNAGFSRANPQRLYLPVIIDPEYHYEALNVENQERNQSSLLWWMKNIIALRKRFLAFGHGSMDFILSRNTRVLSFVRRFQDEILLVVVNLSRHPQAAALDLSGLAGRVPEEVFSRNRFPAIGREPYSFTLNSYGYYLFSLVPETVQVTAEAGGPPTCHDLGNGGFLDVEAKSELEARSLPAYLARCDLLTPPGRGFASMHILDAVPVGTPQLPSWLVICLVRYLDGPPLVFNQLLSFALGEAAGLVLRNQPQIAICAYAHGPDQVPAVVFEGLHAGEPCARLLALASRKARIKGRSGEIMVNATRPGLAPRDEALELKAAMSTSQRVNTLVVFGERYFLKLFRRSEGGPNPDLEIVRYLTEQAGFDHTPAVVGAVQYQRTGAEPVVVAVLKEYLRAENDAGKIAADAFARVLTRCLSLKDELAHPPQLPASPAEAAFMGLPGVMRELLPESDLELFGLMGRRVAELHLSLARTTTDKAFSPEPFSMLYQRSVYQSMQSTVKKATALLLDRLNLLSEADRALAEEIVEARKDVLARLKGFYRHKFQCLKTRIHGDLHLDHLLSTGKDFFVIDFEGKPNLPLSQRSLKRSPLRDVADMQRSIHLLAHRVLVDSGEVRAEDRARLTAWADVWPFFVFGAFLRAYLDRLGATQVVPEERQDLTLMIDCFLIEKAYTELAAVLSEPGRLQAEPQAVFLARQALAGLMGVAPA